MNSYHVGFIVDNCVVNRYYRARAMHLVEWDGDQMEGKATETDGVLLTEPRGITRKFRILFRPNNINTILIKGDG